MTCLLAATSMQLPVLEVLNARCTAVLEEKPGGVARVLSVRFFRLRTGRRYSLALEERMPLRVLI